MSSRRLDAGGSWIDRTTTIGFAFDGHAYEGFAGDTLASALLANGVDVVATSHIRARPRGVFSAGVEEPNAFVEVAAPWFDVIAPATMVELAPGLVAKARAGIGRLPADTANVPVPRSEHRYSHVETLVVGGGVAGLRAALAAARAGDRVMLVDEHHRLGGGATTIDEVDGLPAPVWIDRAITELEGTSDIRLLARATGLGVYDDGYVVVHERSRPVERVWHVRAGHVVLATGAHERPIVFENNDRPGIMLASGAHLFAERFGVIPGERAVLFTTNDAAYRSAFALADKGIEIVAIVDWRNVSPFHAEARKRGFDVKANGRVTGTHGDPRVEWVDARSSGRSWSIPADLLLVSGGWSPVVQLWRAIRGGLRYDELHACFLPDDPAPPRVSIVGTSAGDDLPESGFLPFVADGSSGDQFVDLQRDATLSDIHAALLHGFRSTEHVKRDTYIGTAVDQGRTSGVFTAEIVSAAIAYAPKKPLRVGATPRAAPPDMVEPSGARPPYTPVPYLTLAGPDHGPTLLDPVRTTPIHGWHVEHGAVFENVGQWKRPRYFPRRDEDIDAAVARECLAVRTGVGVLDASTLGKIEVAGPDAGEFLDRMYTNRMSSLAIGRIRYGLMLGLDGMVMDDGVAMRLADDRYLVFTTTGGAAAVLDHLEEWLQTEWPDLRVFCTSVTEQWADVAIAGPRAGDVLAAVGADIDLSPGAFPFMTVREGVVADVPARIARVSFTGELSYEVTVAAWHGRHVWDTVMAVGKHFGIAPYGTEAMHLLRAEKGFPIVGQETDGTVTPHDLGMSWIVDREKGDFVGRRSLSRPDALRPDRKQLVGLLPADPHALLPEGAQLVLEDTGRVPMPMAGYVTSSYRSAALGRTLALAMLNGGRDLHGTTVFAPLPSGTIAAEVTSPIFWDPENRRRDGDPDGGGE